MTEPHELKRLMIQMAELLEHFRRHGESIRDANRRPADLTMRPAWSPA